MARSAWPGFEFGLGNFLGEREVFSSLRRPRRAIWWHLPNRRTSCRVEKELSVFAAFFEAGQIFQDFCSASVIACAE